MTEESKPESPWTGMQKALRLRFSYMLGLLLLWYYGPSGLAFLLGEESFAAGEIFSVGLRLGVMGLTFGLLPSLFKTPYFAVGIAKPEARDFKLGASFALLSGGVFALLILALLGILHWSPEVFGEMVKGETALQRLYSLAALRDTSTQAFLITVIALPIMEEFFFRGLLYAHLRREFGVRYGIAISALIFAFAHANSVPVSQLIGGVFFALAFEMTGRIWVSIGLHMLGNGALFLLSMQMAEVLS